MTRSTLTPTWVSRVAMRSWVIGWGSASPCSLRLIALPSLTPIQIGINRCPPTSSSVTTYCPRSGISTSEKMRASFTDGSFRVAISIAIVPTPPSSSQTTFQRDEDFHMRCVREEIEQEQSRHRIPGLPLEEHLQVARQAGRVARDVEEPRRLRIEQGGD